MTESIEAFIRYLGWIPGESQFNVMTFKPMHGVSIVNTDDLHAAEDLITKYNGKQSLYVTLNPIKIGTKAKKPKDSDVANLNNVYIDIDRANHAEFPKKDYPANEAELSEAKHVTNDVLTELATIGIKDPLCEMTGNGYRIIIPVSGLVKKMHHAFLKKLHDKFGEAIDTGVADLSRVTGVPGTINVKSKETEDRLLRTRTPWTPHERMEYDSVILLRYISSSTTKLIDVPTKSVPVPSVSSHHITIENAMVIDDKENEGMLRKLISGNISGCGFDDRSRAEMSLADRLVYYGFSEIEIADVLINRSSIGKATKRSHTKGDNYVSDTIRKAFAEVTDRYEDFTTFDQPTDDNTDDWINAEIKMIPVVSGFIADYIEYTTSISDAYIEYQYAGALALLSAIVGRSQYVKTTVETVYPNLFVLILGSSTMTRKTTVVNNVESMLSTSGWDGGKLPTTFTPQALIEMLNMNPHRFHIVDEVGSWLAELERSYMAGMKDDLCRLYSGTPISRTLAEKNKSKSDTEMVVDDPYLGILYATTPENLLKTMSTDDIVSGFLARFVICAPEYQRPLRPIEMMGTDAEMQREKCAESLNNIIDWLDTGVKIQIHDDAFKKFQEWEMQHEERIQKEKNRIDGAIISRSFMKVLKIALLLAVSDKNKYIEKRYIDEAIRQTDEFWLPVMRGMVKDIEINANKSIIGKMRGHIKRRGGTISRRELQRSAHLLKKDFDLHINTMLEYGIIRTEKKEEGNRSIDIYILLEDTSP